MGQYLTKAFFKAKLKDHAAHGVLSFEIAPPPDCCPKCEAKANKRIAISTATKNDYPPFHKECRCDIMPLWDDREIGWFNKEKSRWTTGVYNKNVAIPEVAMGSFSHFIGKAWQIAMSFSRLILWLFLFGLFIFIVWVIWA